MAIDLVEITSDNFRSVVALRLAPGQERFVSSVADSLEEAEGSPHGNPWFRPVYADGQPVGLVMLSWTWSPGRPTSTAHCSCGSYPSTTGTGQGLRPGGG